MPLGVREEANEVLFKALRGTDQGGESVAVAVAVANDIEPSTDAIPSNLSGADMRLYQFALGLKKRCFGSHDALKQYIRQEATDKADQIDHLHPDSVWIKFCNRGWVDWDRRTDLYVIEPNLSYLT